MIEKNTNLDHLISLYGRLPQDEMFIFMLAHGAIRGALIQNTVMVNQLRHYHDLGIIQTLALGHAFTSCGLLSSNMKGTEKVILGMDCTGRRGVSCEALATGEIRGYLKHKEIEITRPLDNLDLAPFIGMGFLLVTRYLASDAEPFTGQVVLQNGRFAEDLAYYYLMSEQIPSAVSLSVSFDSAGRVSGAGGLLLQAMPDADPDLLDTLTEKVTRLPSLGKLFESARNPENVLASELGEFAPEILARRNLRFYCSCSKERFAGFLSALPQEDRTEMAENGPFPIVLSCFNCSSDYLFSEEEIRVIAG